MLEFARLLDALFYTSSRLAKEAMLLEYFTRVPDPDRGLALAAITENLAIPHLKRALIRDIVTSVLDPYLYDLSRDYVGETAETVALIWPAGEPGDGCDELPALHEVVGRLQSSSKDQLRQLVPYWLDCMSPAQRWAFLKLATGALRVGVSERLAKQVLAKYGQKDVHEVEEVWHAVKPPYEALFAWLEGKAERPETGSVPTFRPVMLSHPLEGEDWKKLDPLQWQAEWKWDGVRTQLVATGSEAALFTRTGEDISGSFPDLIAGMEGWSVVLDGELLVVHPETGLGSFNDLQQRLGRKNPVTKLMKDYPAFFRAYDILEEEGENLRKLPLRERRARLADWTRRHPDPRIDMSEAIAFSSLEELSLVRLGIRDESGTAQGTTSEHSSASPLVGEALRRRGGQQAEPAANVNTLIEGFMLKKHDSPYISGRPKGHWYKWKRDALLVDAVLIYAQRGSGKRSSFYSDYTFGCWDGDALVPVGKAYSGYTDEELAKLDRWIRNNTIERFGPVRAVKPEIVMELAFDAVQESARHKSGVAMRFPRIHRIRWDKPAAEADTLATLKALIA